MLCDELKWKWAYGPYLDPPEGQKESAIKAGYVKVVSKQSADAAIAELKDKVKFCSDFELAARNDIKEMRGQHQMLKQFGHYKLSPVPGHMIKHEMRQYVSYNVVCMIINHLERETKKLKAEIESLKASHYAEMVDAGMRERRLRRALWVTRTAMAKSEKDRWNAQVDCGNRRNRKDPAYVKTGKLLEVSEWRKLWADNEIKCLKKAEEYK